MERIGMVLGGVLMAATAAYLAFRLRKERRARHAAMALLDERDFALIASLEELVLRGEARPEFTR